MAGKNIVLVHGWGSSVQKLELLKSSLQKNGWKIFVPKLPGFDASDPPHAWKLDDYARYVFQKSSVFFNGESFYLFGHSFGGGVAVKIALMQNSSSVSGLILCATRGITRTNILKRLTFLFLAKVGKAFLIIPSLANLWKKIIYKLAREHDYEKSQGIMREVFKNVVNEDLRPQVSKIKIPTLILWGSQDRMTPVKGAYYLKSKVRNSKLVEYKDQGHRLPYEKPAEVSDKINQWVDGLS